MSLPEQNISEKTRKNENNDLIKYTDAELVSGKHQLVIINGNGGAGKSTFASFCIDYAKRKYKMYGAELSTVDWPKEVARFCGWSGRKEEIDRKFLSDLKMALEAWDDSPSRKVFEQILAYDNTKDWLVFVNCREPSNIERFIKMNNEITHWPCLTLLVKNDRNPIITSNIGDASVFNYRYNKYIYNNFDLLTLRKMAEQFVDEIYANL